MYSAGMHGKNLLEDLPQSTFSAKTNRFFSHILSVPDMRSRDHEVVVVRGTIILGAGIWNGEGLRKGRSVHE
jgi:hypothetical protein